LKLVFEGKISLEGSLEEVRSPLAALLMQIVQQQQQPVAIEETKEDIALPSEPIAPQIESPAITISAFDGESIITRVMQFITDNPEYSISDIAEKLGLSASQAKTAVMSLRKKNQIVTTDASKRRNSGWKKADTIAHVKKNKTRAEPAAVVVEPEAEPVGISHTILAYIRKNPNLTAREIATQTGIPYNQVTSVVYSLKTANKATFTGKGGHNDPYRYSVV
jgi:DNA-binding MarR family transcriptional regulator